jgi:hypothetical protein
VLTIHSLEVRFDVAAGSDEEVFARLFERHMRTWKRLASEAEQRGRQAEHDRRLDDVDQGWMS